MILTSAADPDPDTGTFLTPESGIRMGKYPDGSYFRELRTIFWVKNTKILGCGSRSRIRDIFDPG
jgi:hypothetical protein